MTIFKSVLSVVAAGMFVSSIANAASSDEVVVSVGQSKGGAAISLDVVSSGKTVAFNFAVSIPAGAKVDTSKCLASLPKSHKGRCEFVGGEVRVIAYSESLAAIPAGVTQIGTIKVAGGDASFKYGASRVELSDSKGAAISTSALVQ